MTRRRRDRVVAITMRVAGRPIGGMALLALRATRSRRAIVLVFHRVDANGAGMTRPTHPRVFAAQVRDLRRWCRIVPASEIFRTAAARRRWERFPVALTFDDDLPSHRHLAAPLLARAGVSGAFFVNGASLREAHEFWWELLDRALQAGIDVRALVEAPRNAPTWTLGEIIERWSPEQRAGLSRDLADRLGGVLPSAGLRAADVRAIEGLGHMIGFHTRWHHRLTGLSQHDVDLALKEGRSELEAVVGHSIDVLAYPHGAASPHVAERAATAGFSLGFTVGREAVEPGVDPLMIPRLEASPESAGRLVLQLVRTLSAGRSR